MFNAFARTISGTSARRERDAAEDLWQLVLYGINAGS